MRDGILRIRAKGDKDGMPAIGDDATMEVFVNGEWHRVAGMVRAAITVSRHDIVHANIDVELAEVDLDVWPEHLAAILGKR
jgi:hypothetical protein